MADSETTHKEELKPGIRRCVNSGAACFIQRDRISELPDDVLDLIMLKVSLRDRVKASVVSRRWNKICLSPSEIRLDWPNCLVTANNDIVDKDNHNELCPVYQDVFVNNVNQFLASFRGNHVRSFYLRFCLTSSSKNDIDGWIRFAVRTGVQSICLISSCYTFLDFRNLYDNDPELALEDIQYVIGIELFDTPQCNLKSLQLGGCNLGADFAKHLSSLTTLSLSYSFLAQHDLQTMFSRLPKLLVLVLSRCTLPVDLSLSCLPSLRTFKLKHCSGVEQIYLSNVKLRWFAIYTEEAVRCNLRGCPNLMSLGCSATRVTMPNFFKRIPKDAPMLTKLNVMYHGELADLIPDSIYVFTGVTRLEWYFKPKSQLGIMNMVDILKAFPLLRVLILVIDNAKNLEQHELTHANYKPEHLSEVALYAFCGTSGQMDFVVYLLEHAVTLKRLSIRCRKSWGERAQQDFLSKIEGFRKDVKVRLS